MLPPICSLLNGLNDAEFDVDTTDSVGLPGRSGTGARADGGDALLLVATGDGEGLTRLELGAELFCTDCTFKEEVDPLKVANRRRKSSNGAPELDAWSTLEPRGTRPVCVRKRSNVDDRRKELN
jgi:hypothetical protein